MLLLEVVVGGDATSNWTEPGDPVERHSVRVRPAGAPIHAADGKLLFALLGELRLDSYEPLLRELPSVAPGTTPCPADVGAAVDLRAFVGTVGASAAAIGAGRAEKEAEPPNTGIAAVGAAMERRAESFGPL